MPRPDPGSVAAIIEKDDGCTLDAVGSGVRVPNAISWMPSHPSGWLPFQCYVFRAPTQTLILDTGIAIHRDAIGEGLAALLPPSGQRACLVSRWEPDAIINLPWLVEQFGVEAVHSVGELNPIDFFTNFDNATVAAQVEASAPGARLVSVVPGEVIRIGSFEIEVLRTTLRLLLTNWFFERTTGSLFTTDSFGFLVNPDAPRPFKTASPASDISVERLADTLRLKFEWLVGADTAPLAGDLSALRRALRIERICPMFGGTIEGAGPAAAVLEATEQALLRLGAEKPASTLAAFDWARAFSPDALQRVEDLPRPAVPVCS